VASAVPSVLVASAAVVAAAAGASAAAAGEATLAAAVLLGQLLLAWSWASLQRASGGTAAIVASAAVASDAALLARDRADVGDLAAVVGLAVVAVVVHQLARRRVRPASASAAGVNGAGEPARVTVDMAAALSGVGLVALFAIVLALPDRADRWAQGWLPAAAGLLGVGAGVGASRLVAAAAPGRAPALRHGVLGAGLGVAAGAGAGAVFGVCAEISLLGSVALAGAGAGAALAVDVGLAREQPADGARGEPAAGGGFGVPAATLVVAALAPFAVAAPVVYLVSGIVGVSGIVRP
jgi:hypothetical protein